MAIFYYLQNTDLSLPLVYLMDFSHRDGGYGKVTTATQGHFFILISSLHHNH